MRYNGFSNNELNIFVRISYILTFLGFISTERLSSIYCSRSESLKYSKRIVPQPVIIVNPSDALAVRDLIENLLSIIILKVHTGNSSITVDRYRLVPGTRVRVIQGNQNNHPTDEGIIYQADGEESIWYDFPIGNGGINRHVCNLVDIIEIINNEEEKKIIEMRKTITVGDYVKVVDPARVYKDMDEKGGELGADKLKWFSKTIAKDMEGEVKGIEDGFVLVDLGDNHVLFDIDALVKLKKPSEIGFLVYYIRTKTIEEYSTMAEVDARVQELFASGSITLADNIKLYQVTNSKKINLKLEVFLG
jgi:hypothetical protein